MAMKFVDDQVLVHHYLEGNEQAFEVLLMRHKDKIYRSIYHKIREREIAEDIFQETFVKIVQTLKLGNYNEEGKFLPWAMRIAQNLVIDYFRKHGRMKMVSERNAKSEDFNIFSVLKMDTLNVEQSISKDELEKQLIQLVRYLPESQKDIIEKRIFQDLSFKDIAEMEDISINTALGRMRYALINLRKLIEKHQLVTDLD
ncbi:sigma-70 family RNA polymerase sigma factor [Fluviicola sp.]|jgi:RNA polymerase sigma-70 factor (ECF subfamily)|uniref:RNA polymerase sigma factor n=1 Tax=Fluviicola sp. TaxID=1917219 RepID=UPI00282E4E62|nr:sigma-70 family RNA polymerase sigma factor [Fluviicola sp.]MDR0802805.1 sigma-70 family RNA polymerase sigma factor [Fluviicola sp.]